MIRGLRSVAFAVQMIAVQVLFKKKPQARSRVFASAFNKIGYSSQQFTVTHS